jgi:hypothetical protein
MSSFKVWFVVVVLKVQRCFGVDALGFQIELLCRHFDLFLLVDCMAISSSLLALANRKDPI